MSSKPLGRGRWDSTWGSLPGEIRLLILEFLMSDGCSLAPFATVSRDWQTVLEKHNFARIRLTPSRLSDFSSMIHRNRRLVRYIWFCLELEDDPCSSCGTYSQMFTGDSDKEEPSAGDTATGLVSTTAAFENLFSILSTWDSESELTLDISTYSIGDAKHWFKYLTFAPDTPADMLEGGYAGPSVLGNSHTDPQHDWLTGHFGVRLALAHIFFPVMLNWSFATDALELKWWDQLPLVPAVTCILLRQQNYRRLLPRSLAHMLPRFPNLRELHYEPWREWGLVQRLTDADYLALFTSLQRHNSNLRRLVVFENFNQQFPPLLQRFLGGVDVTGCDSIRTPSPSVSRELARASFNLEHFAASFIVDARVFFQIKPAEAWPNLTSLVLTSTLLTPDGDLDEIGAMLKDAAESALMMPQLETMEIWYGQKGMAALFKYEASRQSRQATLTWRATWELAITLAVTHAWEAVAQQHQYRVLDLVQERLSPGAIRSHGDAISHLKLTGETIRPVSLHQIQIEQKALEGMPTL